MTEQFKRAVSGVYAYSSTIWKVVQALLVGIGVIWYVAIHDETTKTTAATVTTHTKELYELREANQDMKFQLKDTVINTNARISAMEASLNALIRDIGSLRDDLRSFRLEVNKR